MGLQRHIAHLLVLAIVLIAGLIMPSAAMAHDGHAHHGAGHLRQATPAASLVVKHRDAEFAVASVKAAGLLLRTSLSRHACAAGCPACAGNTGCCATAMITISLAALPARPGRPIAMAPREVLATAGTGPEALHEPPRSQA